MHNGRLGKESDGRKGRGGWYAAMEWVRLLGKDSDHERRTRYTASCCVVVVINKSCCRLLSLDDQYGRSVGCSDVLIVVLSGCFLESFRFQHIKTTFGIATENGWLFIAKKSLVRCTTKFKICVENKMGSGQLVGVRVRLVMRNFLLKYLPAIATLCIGYACVAMW